MYMGRVVDPPADQVFARRPTPTPGRAVAHSPLPALPRRAERLGGEPRSPIDPDPHALAGLHGPLPRCKRILRDHAPELVATRPGQAARWPYPIKAL